MRRLTSALALFGLMSLGAGCHHCRECGDFPAAPGPSCGVESDYHAPPPSLTAEEGPPPGAPYESMPAVAPQSEAGAAKAPAPAASGKSSGARTRAADANELDADQPPAKNGKK